MARPEIPKPAFADSITGIPTDTLSADSIAADTLTADSVHPALILQPHDVPHHAAPREASHAGSWLLLALIALMVAVGLKFRNSTNYISLLARDLTNTRRRNNLFDDTVRETSFLMLLNLVSLLSGGLLLYLYIRRGQSTEVTGAAMVMGLSVAYGIFLWICYTIAGWTFTDRTSMHIWRRGHSAAQALLGLALLPLSLVAVADTQLVIPLCIAAAILFLIAKIIFIYKGLRIFIDGFASIVLFFYYLCGLEIVPLILAYLAACHLSTTG